MSRIKNIFQKTPATLCFITAAHPDLETTKEIIKALEEAGCDSIIMGIPFSDPIAEGPVVQSANIRALSNGFKIENLFEMITDIKKTVNVPLILRTYANPIFVYGKEKFMKNCAESGIDGIIIPDLPYEEKEEFLSECNIYNIELISFISTASEERMNSIIQNASGFLYCVPSPNNFNKNGSCDCELENLISHIKTVSDIPCVIDYDNSERQNTDRLCNADGIIISDSIIEMIIQNGKNSVNIVKKHIESVRKNITN